MFYYKRKSLTSKVQGNTINTIKTNKKCIRIANKKLNVSRKRRVQCEIPMDLKNKISVQMRFRRGKKCPQIGIMIGNVLVQTIENDFRDNQICNVAKVT